MGWWRDWKNLNSLPFGGSDVLAQPAYVTQVIRTAEQTANEIAQARDEERRREAERARKPRKAR